MAAELADMLENYRDADIPKLKELLRRVIRKIDVNSRERNTPVHAFANGSRYDRFSGLN